MTFLAGIEQIAQASYSHPIAQARLRLKKLRVLPFPIASEEPSLGKISWEIKKDRVVSCIRQTDNNTILYANPFLGERFARKDGDESEDLEDFTAKNYNLVCDKKKKFYFYDPKDNVRSSSIPKWTLINALSKNADDHIGIKSISTVKIDVDFMPRFGIALQLIGEESDFIPGCIWRLFGYHSENVLRIGEVVPRRKNQPKERFTIPPDVYLRGCRVDILIYMMITGTSLYTTYLHPSLLTAAVTCTSLFLGYQRRKYS